jgi:hypothetical protein
MGSIEDSGGHTLHLIKGKVSGKFHTVTFHVAQFFTAWVSLCMVENNYTYGEENLMNNEKFQDVLINSSGYSHNCCRIWQHQPPKHYINVECPKIYVL